MSLIRITITLTLAILSIVQHSPAQGQENTPERFEVVAEIGGPITDSVPLLDGSVLAAEGSSLVRIRSDFGPLEVLARADLERGMILALRSAPPYVLVLTENGLAVLPNTSDGIPAPITYLAGGGQTMVVEGNLIAVASRQAGLRLIRLDPSGALTELSRFVFTAPNGETASALDVTLSADLQFAYVAAGDQGVQMVDIRNTSAPAPFGALVGITPAEALTRSGALLAVGSNGRVVMTDPTPGGGVVGVYAPLRDGRRILVQDGYAYVADQAEGVKILWLAAPDRPLLVYGEADQPAADLALVGNFLFVAGHGELRVLDVSSRYRPLALGRVALPGNAESITLEVDEQGFPNRAFIAMGDDGAAVVDVRNFAQPRVLRHFPLEGAAHATHYLNGVLYVALDTAGIAMISASEFGSEQLYGVMALPGRALDLEQRGSTLYVAAGQEGILALDIFYPYQPKLVGSLPLEPISSSGDIYEASSLTIAGKRAYVADGAGFTVVDVSFPTRMGKLARIDTPAAHLGVDGIYLYAAGGSQVGIYDARATAEPIALHQYRGLSKIAHLTAEGSYLFATSAEAGPDAVTINIASPDAPVETSSTGTVGNTVRFNAAGETLWLSAGLAGLHRYQLSEGGALIPRGSYAPVTEASVLEARGGRLFAGGQKQWSILDAVALQTSFAALGAENLVDLVSLDQRAAILSQSLLELYDLSAADAPLRVASHEVIGGTAVEMDANYVYVAGAQGLTIYEQTYLLPIAEVRTPFAAVDLVVGDSIAYLALRNGSLAVIELADPTGGIERVKSIPTRHPTELIPSPDGDIYGLADEVLMRLFTDDVTRLGVIEDGTLPIIAPDGLFAGGLFGLVIPGDQVRFYQVLGLEDGITWKSAVTLGAEAITATATQRMVYAANGEGGLISIERSATQTVTVLDHAPTYAVLVVENLLFAAGDSLSVWDVGGNLSVELARVSLTSPARAIDLSGDMVLISTESGLSMLDWDGTSLNVLGTLLAPAADQTLIVGDRAYLALHRGGLMVADIADPQKPTTLFTYISPSGQFVQDMLLLDESHLLVSWENGIDALNVDGPTPAPHLSTVAEFGGVQGIALALGDDSILAALSQGSAGVLLLDLADPLKPDLLGTIQTPGEARNVMISGQTIFVADGQCGLRAFDAADPQDVQAMGAWRGAYAGSLVETSGVIYVGSGNRLYGLRYDPSMPPPTPFMPQIPIPADGSSTETLETVLRWGPPEDACDPLTYEVYFGVDADPPFVGQVSGEPLLDVGKLEPQRTYFWRVEAVSAQGSRSRGPVWRFTTAEGTFPDRLPPAPPPFLDAMQQNPMVPFGLVTLFLVIVGIGVLYWRGKYPAIQADIPEWYSTQEEEEFIEDE